MLLTVNFDNLMSMNTNVSLSNSYNGMKLQDYLHTTKFLNHKFSSPLAQEALKALNAATSSGSKRMQGNSSILDWAQLLWNCPSGEVGVASELAFRVPWLQLARRLPGLSISLMTIKHFLSWKQKDIKLKVNSVTFPPRVQEASLPGLLGTLQ